MKELLGLLLLILLALGCSCREDPRANTGRKAEDLQPDTHGLPLVIEIDVPEVPPQIMGPTPKLE